MTLMDPQTSAEWLAVGRARSADASALEASQRRLGALYFFGFAAECFVKAYILAAPGGSRRSVNGHDLIELLGRVNVARLTLPYELRVVAERRHVSLRYQRDVPPEWPDDEVQKMMTLASWLERRALRDHNRRRNRG